MDNGSLISKPNVSGSWSLQRGFVGESLNNNTYPLRTVISSAKKSFIIWLQSFKSDFEQVCRGLQLGYKVFTEIVK